MSVYGWQRYLSIEQDFIKAQYYVSFDIKDAYSEFFSREVILLGSEIESAFKELCKRIDGSTPGNIGQYKQTILSFYPGIINVGVINKQTNEIQFPFKDWDSSTLSWWEIYSNTKHALVDKTATLQVALIMLQALELLFFCITTKSASSSIFLDYLETPRLFKPAFQPGFAIMGDMNQVYTYSKQEIEEILRGNSI